MDDIAIVITCLNFKNNDFDKISLLSCSKNLHLLKNRIFFNDLVAFEKINYLWYFDRFTNVRVCLYSALPKYVRRLTFGMLFNSTISGLLLVALFIDIY